MRRSIFISVFSGCIVLSAAAQATPVLLGIGSLSGSADLSGLAGNLESGVAANILGGLGSGLAYAGGNTFLALPDRGPNATVYNAAVDHTTSYIPRFQTLNITLTPSMSGLPLTVTPTLTRTTLLSSSTPLVYGTGAGLGLGSGAPAQNTAGTYYFSGRSDNFGAGNSGNPANGRFDPEGVRVSPDGRSVYMSDEYGPYVYKFDRISGQRLATYTLPANLNVANLAPVGTTETAANTSGRTDNKGMEGLAITPDGSTLVGFMQAPLIQDKNKMVRLVTIDVATGTTKEYAYRLTDGSGVSEVVAINNHEFLVIERDGKGQGDGSNAVIKQIFKIDLNGATEVTNVAVLSSSNAALAIPKTLVLDIVQALLAAGIPASEIPAKIEGLAFGQDQMVGNTLYHTLFVANDNDFLPGIAGDNRFYVFGFTDTDLPNFANEQVAAVPEPSTWAMMMIGFAGLAFFAHRRRRSAMTASA